MESVQQCPKNGCDYSGNEHGLKTHFAVSHEDSKYGRVSLSCDTCGTDFSRPQWKVKSERLFLDGGSGINRTSSYFQIGPNNIRPVPKKFRAQK